MTVTEHPRTTSTPGTHPQDGEDRDCRALFLRSREGDRRAREELIEHFSPLARKLARRYRNTSEPWEDLSQVAHLGLVKAVDGFDPDRGFVFASYAIPTILGELRRHFRDAAWAVRVPRTLQERALQTRDVERALGDELGRSPTVPELAQFMEVSVEETLDALQALRALGSSSLDAPRANEADDEGDTYAEVLGAEDPRYELVELGADVAGVLKGLGDRDREILRLRFFEDLTQREIAARIGSSQMQVSRLLAKCLEQLREQAHPEAS